MATDHHTGERRRSYTWGSRMGMTEWSQWLGGVLAMAALACSAGVPDDQPPSRDWAAERQRMVDQQLRARDIRSARVLDAMRSVPRHLFIPEASRRDATTTRRSRSATARRSP